MATALEKVLADANGWSDVWRGLRTLEGWARHSTISLPATCAHLMQTRARLRPQLVHLMRTCALFNRSSKFVSSSCAT